MSKKECFKCHKIKDLEDFYKYSKMADGHLNKCKVCARTDANKNPKKYIKVTAFKETEPRYCRRCKRKESETVTLMMTTASSRRYFYVCRECNRERCAKYRSTEKGKKAIKSAYDRSRSKPTYPKYWLVSEALKKGVISKPLFCEVCGLAKKLDGHHEDYSKVLDVKWLCRQCHADLHRAKRATIIGNGKAD